ncbi:MAG: galactarate dehydratase [Bryobacterales bacterium]|nr:galactarate dehydratase [Bryobacterales bacterium]
MTPRYVRIHPRDNVAIVVNEGGLKAGTAFPDGLVLAEPVREAHKVALEPIPKGQPIRRYGEVIGLAGRDINAGAWVREEFVELPAPPALDQVALATAAPPAGASIGGLEFDGYPNPDGAAGTRNILAITTTVQCVAPTVEFAVRRIRDEILPHYPGVDGVMALAHAYGCGVAIDAPDAEIPIRTLRNLSLNPNISSEPLVVSLGCEKLPPSRLFPEGSPLPVLSGEPWVVRLQDEEYRGFGDMVAAIMRLAEKRIERLSRRQRVPCPASLLNVGVQCGGSDAFSGVTANPVVGHAADLLVRAGATVMFSEVTEVRDAVHLLGPRAATVEVGRALLREMAWFDEYLRRGSADRSANPTPGNKRGGLSNIVEKALGSVAKSGTSALTHVAGPGERVSAKGLVFAATPASDFICGTLQTAAGMNVHVFTTGEGTPYGLGAVPVIKISSRTALARRWPDLIDLDAGRVASGESTLEQMGWELVRLILDTASGRNRACAERWKLDNPLALFNPAPVT